MGSGWKMKIQYEMAATHNTDLSVSFDNRMHQNQTTDSHATFDSNDDMVLLHAKKISLIKQWSFVRVFIHRDNQLPTYGWD